MILNHSAGLPAFRTQVKEGGFFDWDYMVELLENEEPSGYQVRRPATT